VHEAATQTSEADRMRSALHFHPYAALSAKVLLFQGAQTPDNLSRLTLQEGEGYGLLENPERVRLMSSGIEYLNKCGISQQNGDGRVSLSVPGEVGANQYWTTHEIEFWRSRQTVPN